MGCYATIEKMFDESNYFLFAHRKLSRKYEFPAENFSSNQIDWVNIIRAQRVFGLYLPSVVRGLSLQLLSIVKKSKRNTEKIRSCVDVELKANEDDIQRKTKKKVILYRFEKEKKKFIAFITIYGAPIKIPPTSKSIAYNWCDILSISCRAFILTDRQHQCCL